MLKPDKKVAFGLLLWTAAKNTEVKIIPNQTAEEAEKLVEMARHINPNVLLEASGGMDLDKVRSFAEAGVDLISVGRLTHSAKAVDISFKIQTI